MNVVANLPRFIDFTEPRLGHAVNVNSLKGSFGRIFKVFDLSVYFDSSSTTIGKGDILKVSRPNEPFIRMFKIVTLQEDDETPNVVYCDAVLCGYFLSEPRYFNGFKEEWEKQFPSQVITVKTKSDLQKTAEQIYGDQEKYMLLSALGISLLLLVIFVIIGMLLTGIRF